MYDNPPCCISTDRVWIDECVRQRHRRLAPVCAWLCQESLPKTHDNATDSRLTRPPCGTLKCENAAICEKVAKCEKYSTLNVKIDAICEKITLNVKK